MLYIQYGDEMLSITEAGGELTGDPCSIPGVADDIPCD